jgi:Mg2+/Co2+ transporter CorB
MQPSEALSASAQIAVALAGFAGVVVAFRNRSLHEWSKIDKFRLRILLTNSVIPFAASIIAMVLSSTTLDSARVWQLCSIITFVMIINVAAIISRGYRRFSREEFAAAGGSSIAFFSSSVVGVAVTLLQLYNAITLKTFWPFFAAIATLLLLAILQFILLVTAGHDAKS